MLEPISAPGSLPSDRKLKKNIQPIRESLAKVKRLRGLYYHWGSSEMNQFDKRRHIGLMAQDLQHVVPEAVIPSEDGDFLTVDYNSLVALLIEAIRELEQQTDKTIRELELRDELLDSRLQVLEAKSDHHRFDCLVDIANLIWIFNV